MATQAEIDFIVKMRDEASAILKNLGNNFGTAGAQADKAGKSAATAGKGVNSFADAMTEAASAVSVIHGPLGGIASRFSALGTAVRTAGVEMAALGVITAGVGFTIAASTKAWSQYELGLIGVEKTTNMSKAQMAEFRNEFDLMAREMKGLKATELLDIAAAAGQMGVTGKQDLLAFTRTMGELGVSTDIVGEQGSAMAARLLKLTEGGVSGVRKFGDSLAFLGNNTAARESEILEMATAVATNTANVNLSTDAVLALAAAAKESGLRDELAGSMIGRTLTIIKDAAAQATPEFNQFREMIGLTKQEFDQLISTNPEEVFLRFSQVYSELDKSGQGTNFLKGFKLNTIEAMRVLGTTGKQVDVFRDKIAQLQSGQQSGALGQESGKFFGAQANQIIALGEAWESVKVAIGEALAPLVGPLVQGATAALTAIADGIRALPAPIATIAAAFATITPVIMLVRSAAGALSVMFGGISVSGTVMAGVMKLASGAMTAAGVALRFLLGPIGLIITGITALIAVVKYFGDKTYEVNGQVVSGWTVLEAGLSALAAFFKSVWDDIGGYVETGMRIVLAVMTLGMSELVPYVIDNWDSIVTAVQEAWDAIVPYVETGMRIVLGIMTLGMSEVAIAVWDNWDSIKQAFNDNWEAIKDATMIAMRVLLGIITLGMSEIAIAVWNSDVMQRAGKAAGEAFGNGIKEGAKGSGNAAAAAAGGGKPQGQGGFTPNTSLFSPLGGGGRRGGGARGARGGGSKSDPYGDAMRDLARQLELAKATTAEEKNLLEVKHKIEDLQKNGLKLTEKQKAALTAQIQALQAAKATVAFDEMMRDLDDALDATMALTRAERDRVAIKQKLAEFERSNGELSDANRAAFESAMATNLQVEAFNGLRDTLDPIGKANRDYADDLRTLNAEFKDKSTAEYAFQLERLNRTYADSLNPMRQYLQSQREQVTLLRTVADQRGATQETMRTMEEFRDAGLRLSTAQWGELADAVQTYNMEMEAAARADSSGIRGWMNSIPTLRDDLQGLIGDTTSSFSQGLADALGSLSTAPLRSFLQTLGKNMVQLGVNQLLKMGMQELGAGSGNPALDRADAALAKIEALSNAGINTSSALVNATGTVTISGLGVDALGPIGGPLAGVNDNGVGAILGAANDNMGGLSQTVSQVAQVASQATGGLGGFEAGLGALVPALGAAVPGLGGLVQGLMGLVGGLGGGGGGGGMPWLGGLGMLAGIFHKGGIVGPGGPSRMVPAGLFANAPRFHSGLGNKEFAAILEKGERVLTSQQSNQSAAVIEGLTGQVRQLSEGLSRRGGMGGRSMNQSINMTVNARDADSFRKSEGQVLADAQLKLARVGRANN